MVCYLVKSYVRSVSNGLSLFRGFDSIKVYFLVFIIIKIAFTTSRRVKGELLEGPLMEEGTQFKQIK